MNEQKIDGGQIRMPNRCVFEGTIKFNKNSLQTEDQPILQDIRNLAFILMWVAEMLTVVVCSKSFWGHSKEIK